MQFRTDISFLRAISVLMVMLYHFNVVGFSGGFIGVDIFFVISGYLMTLITLKSFDKNQFSLLDFYKKRAIRIIPPLQIIFVFILLISIFLFFESDLRLNAKYVFLSNLFSSNIYFWQYQNYFTSGDNILLHTWSLGVEWQFYIIYPLLLLGLRNIYKTRERLFWIILIVFTLISLFLMLVLFNVNNNFTFYMLPSRMWELSIGGIIYGINKKYQFPLLYRKIITYVSILTIVIGIYSISESIVWPSYYTLLPIVSTCLILICNLQTSLFDNKIIKFFGDISYSLYLWHWPLFILFQYYGLFRPEHTIALIVLSVFFAIISYYGIEKSKFFTNIRFVILSVIFTFIISSVIFFKPETFTKFSFLKNDRFKIVNYQNEYLEKYRESQFNPCGCYVSDNTNISNYNDENCLTISDSKKNILLLGDSHMAQFSQELRKDPSYNWLELSLGYTLPLLINNGKPERSQLREDVFNRIVFKNNNKIDLVIISAHWPMMHTSSINLPEKEVFKGIINLISKLENYKINYLIVGQTESYRISYPKVQMLKQFGRNENEFFRNEEEIINDKLSSLIPAENYINIYNLSNINRLSNTGNETYMFDGNHLSNFGSNQYIQKIILPHIKQKLN